MVRTNAIEEVTPSLAKDHRCIDYYIFNRVTIRNKYPFHQIDDLFYESHGLSTFCKINLRSSYNHLKIEAV